MAGRLQGKVALVTAAGQGIGRAIAEAFVREGAQVIATDVDEKKVQDIKGATPLKLDVRSNEAVDALAKRVADEFGALDVLVNCAGVIRRGDEHRPEVFDAVVDINVSGTMRTCSAARPLLARRAGCIVNTASMLSFFGGGLVPAYAASKGGIAQLTKSLAIAYAADRIRVNAVAPVARTRAP